MKKRGPIILIIGAVMIFSAMAVAYSVMQRLGPTGTSEGFFPSPASMFESSSSQETIYPSELHTFSHDATSSKVPIMWGLYIVDYKSGDQATVKITNIYGDKFGTYQDNDPLFIKSFLIPKTDTYYFVVENDGKDPIIAQMMYTDNPENSQAAFDPNSPFYQNLMPLAVSGLMLILGIIVMIGGTVVSVMDWRKGRNPSRYI